MYRFQHLCFFMLFLALVSPFTTPAFAGPPFLTDDPEPVPFKHWEFYLFSTVDATRKSTNGTGPAFEFNVGALPNLQVHLVLPLAFTAPQDEPSAYGLGDMEFGLKYRFIQETDYRPMVGVFPLLEIPTGDANRGLGNGRAWGKLPIWLQKSWGPWTTYGGGGYAINPARDFGPRVFGTLVGTQGLWDNGYWLVPLIAPFIGGAIAMFCYDWFVTRGLPEKA